MTIALILVPAERGELFAAQCHAYCTAMGYKVFGIVTGNWAAAIAMLINHTVSVIVLARPEHLDEIEIDSVDEPRIEFAVPPDPPNARPGERRTHIIQPGEEE